MDEESAGLRRRCCSAVRLFDPARRRRAPRPFAVFCALSGVVYLGQRRRSIARAIGSTRSRRGGRSRRARCRCRRALGAAVRAGGRRSRRRLRARPRASALVAVAYLGAAGPLLRPAEAHRHHRRADDRDRLRPARRRRARWRSTSTISHWLLVCTILLALFIALAKRRHELVLLADGATSHRPILGEYIRVSAGSDDRRSSTASTLIAYIFYTISPETEQKFGTRWLGLTIPFPLYGIFRYLYLVHRREGGGSPADLLLHRPPAARLRALWAVAVVLIIYRPCGFCSALAQHYARFQRPLRLGQRRADHGADPRAHPREARRRLHRAADSRAGRASSSRSSSTRAASAPICSSSSAARSPGTQPPELPDSRVRGHDAVRVAPRARCAFIRRLLHPILKLFFNPNPLIQALHIAGRS